VTTPQDILRYVERRTGHAMNADEGVSFGPADVALTGATVAWAPSPEAIEAAARAGHNCLVHHENLTWPYPGIPSRCEPAELAWASNARRLDLLRRHGLTAVRVHGSADELTIFGAFIDQLGLREAKAGSGYSRKVFESPESTFGRLIEHVKQRVGMAGLRVSSHAADHPVRVIGVPWGGLGLFVNVSYVEQLIEMGANALICGESDNLGFRFATELDIPVIETSHEVSEARGLEILAGQLGRDLGIDCRYAPLPCVWRMA